MNSDFKDLLLKWSPRRRLPGGYKILRIWTSSGGRIREIQAQPIQDPASAVIFIRSFNTCWLISPPPMQRTPSTM